MLFLWFYHACRRGQPRFLMVSDHINYLTFEDPGAVNTVRRALNLAQAGDLYGAAEVAGVDIAHAAAVSEGLRRGMRFSIGAELDNDPRSRPDAQNIVEAMKPDGMIRSVHFLTIDHPEKGADFAWPFDNPEFVSLYDVVGTTRVWELYMERLLDDIEKLPGHIVAHFYVPAKFGHWPDQKTLEKYEDRFLDACASRGMAVEVNTRFLYREESEEQQKKMFDASMRLMRKAKAKKVGIAIGSDAHSPKDQGGAFDIVLKMLDDADINELVFPVAGRLARVALRATREHLERHAKKSEPTKPGSSISGLGRAELGLPEQPDSARTTSRTRRDVGPKKRTTGPERATKAPTKTERSKPAPKGKGIEPPAKKAEPAKKAQPPKKTAVAKKPPVVKKAPAKAAPAKKATPIKKAAVPAKKVASKAAPVKKATPAKKAAAPIKKAAAPPKKAAAPAKKAAPVKKAAAPAKKAASPAKKAAPKVTALKKTPAPKAAPAKKAVPAKKAPVKKVAPAKKIAPAKKTASASKAVKKKAPPKKRK